MKHLLFAALFAMVSTTAIAAEQTIKLSVPGMSCASCPYMVEKAISGVDGIKAVDATMDDRTATVTFDDDVTSIDEITQATANIGYESTLIEADSGS